MATEKNQPDPESILAARFADYVGHLTRLGYTPYQIGIRMGRPGNYIARALKTGACPDSVTIYGLVANWHLNPLWFFTGKGSRVLEKEKLRAIPRLPRGGNRFL